MSHAKTLAAAPAPSAFAGTQLSLFQAFLCNTEEERDQLSNTIELWDSIPKYAISQQAMNQICTTEGLLPRLEKTFVYRKREYRVRVTPAILDAEERGDLSASRRASLVCCCCSIFSALAQPSGVQGRLCVRSRQLLAPSSICPKWRSGGGGGGEAGS